MEQCKRIQIIPFVSKSGEVDPFKLTPLVARRFQSLGFTVSDDLGYSNDCKKLSCVIWHSEHYWRQKSDTVRLSIFNSNGLLLAEYYGVTRSIEMTFKSGYSKATKSALKKIEPDLIEE